MVLLKTLSELLKIDRTLGRRNRNSVELFVLTVQKTLYALFSPHYTSNNV